MAAVALLAACTAIGGKPDSSSSAGAAAAAKPAAVSSMPSVSSAGRAPVSEASQRAFDAALQSLAAGRTSEAERAFLALTKSDPALSGPHANLGLIYRQAGKTGEAVAELEKAVGLNTQRADLMSQLGLAYRTNGDFTKARDAYEKAIALDGNYAPAVLNLGILYDLYLWDGERALELYDRYLQMTSGGDDQVKRWISDLKNRSAKKIAVQRKEQG